MEDLTGKTFGKWNVLERAYDNTKSKGAKWLCQCECGTRKILFGKYLRNGKSKSCGCAHRRNWIGEKFGSLTVMDVSVHSDTNIFSCKCDCGNEVEVIGAAIYGTKSCGCSRRINHIGEKYGRLLIEDVIYNMNGDGIAYAVCTCDCGKTGYITRLSGCARSESTSLSESYIRSLFNELSIEYIQEYVFDDCVGVNGWRLRFDFYLPSYDALIECDGEQHYHPVDFFGGEEKFYILKQNDIIKNEYCKSNNKILLRLPYYYSDENKKQAILDLIHENPVTITA